MDPFDHLGINRQLEWIRQLQQQPLEEYLRQMRLVQPNLGDWMHSQSIFNTSLHASLPEYLQKMDIIRQQNLAAFVHPASVPENHWYTQISDEALRHLQIPQANLTQLFDFQSTFDRIRVQVADFVDPIMSGLGRTLEGFAAISPSLLDSLGLFAEDREVWLNQQMVDTLRYYGWWHVPSMSQELIEEVCEMAIEGKGRSVNARICRHYGENACSILASVVDSWRDMPYFHRRRRIFRAALRGYIEREYLLVVPTLLPLIEGIVRDFLSDIGVTDKYMHWRAVVEIMTLSQSRPNIILVNSFCELLTAIIYGKFEPYETYNGASLKRHPVMHGRTMSYGTRKNALQAFLALDTLHHYLQGLLAKHSVADLSATYRAAVQNAKSAKKATKKP